MDYTTEDVAYVRMLAGDAYDDSRQLFTDAEIEIVITRERTLKRAAASLVLMVANSMVLINRKIRTQDLSTDGPALSAELRALAKQLRDESDEDDNDASPAIWLEPYSECGSVPAELTEPVVWP